MKLVASHLHFACLLILSAVIFSTITSSAGASADCPCKVKGETDTSRCRRGERNVYRRHVCRGLTGSCLPEVEENTVKCFKWKTRRCKDGSDFCELLPQKEDSTTIPVSHHRQTATLLSPRFESLKNKANQKFGERWFCVYNVSLSCARNAIDISSIPAHTSWPKQSNSNCENYLAFYTDRNSALLNDRYCNNEPAFYRRLEGSSFLAVMWTNQDTNAGTFQFTASCKRRTTLIPSSPTQATTVDPTQAATADSSPATTVEPTAASPVTTAFPRHDADTGSGMEISHI